MVDMLDKAWSYDGLSQIENGSTDDVITTSYKANAAFFVHIIFW